jgi:hypothetical protein
VAVSVDELEEAVSSEFEIIERHRDGPFGSWFLTLEGAPRLRLTFDGRDRWLTLEWETDRSWSGLPQWDPLWVGKSEVDLSVPVVMRFLVSARNYAAAAAAARHRG